MFLFHRYFVGFFLSPSSPALRLKWSIFHVNKKQTSKLSLAFRWDFQHHAGLYGNDDLHNGLLEVLTAGRKVDNIISSVRNSTQILESTLANKIRPQLVELADIFDQPASNQTALSQLILSLNIVQGNVSTAKNAATDIRRPLMQVTITSFLSVRLSFYLDFIGV